MQVELPEDAVVIRFPPLKADSVLRSAEKEARRTGGLFGLSIFADVAAPGESTEDVIDRLLEASELAGINPTTNRRYYVCGRADELAAGGFTFWKDEADEDELPEHYNVSIGDAPDLSDAERFVATFEQDVRRRSV